MLSGEFVIGLSSRRCSNWFVHLLYGDGVVVSGTVACRSDTWGARVSTSQANLGFYYTRNYGSLFLRE